MGSHRAGRPETGTPRSRRERIRWAAAGAALAALPAALVVVLSGDSSAPATRLTAHYERTGAWPTGYSGQYILRNLGEDTVEGWTLRFALPGGDRVANVWNGRLERGDRYTVRNEDWNRAVRPGESIVVGFEVRRTGLPATVGGTLAGEPPDGPVNCTINDRPCGGSGTPDAPALAAPAAPPEDPLPGTSPGPAEDSPAASGPATRAPVARPSTSPSGASPTGTPPPSTDSGPATAGTAKTTSPYIDMTLAPPIDAVRITREGGVTDWTLAYVVDGGGCLPMWGGVSRLDDPTVTGRLGDLKAAGGTVRVAFGSGGTDLAAGCQTPEALAAAYRQTLDAAGTDRLDIDIEGRSLVRPDVVERRNRALRILQDDARKAGRPVDVVYTLPVDPAHGLGDEAKALLTDAAARQVEIAHVNIKAFDYGAGVAPHPEGRMGRYAIDAARIAHGQIRGVWPQLTEQQAWARLSVTVMIGRDNVPGEVFTLDDARLLAAFAGEHSLGRIAWWSPARDRPCAVETVTATDADPTCSGVDQERDEYLGILTGG